jgi:endonuclease YncB( thermonuclease family)
MPFPGRVSHTASAGRPTRTLRSFAALFFVGVFMAALNWAAPATADVVGPAKVIDGDTIEVAGERVRLHGIDAPETRQNCDAAGVGWTCGRNATAFLAAALAGREVTCKGNKHDRYGRLIAVCYVGSEDMNARMVRDGWALAYRQYGSDYVAQETEARAMGSGIWQSRFVEPWEWRKQLRASN